MKIKELIAKLEQMPPDGNAAFISGMFIYGNELSYEMAPYKPEKKQEAKHENCGQ